MDLIILLSVCVGISAALTIAAKMLGARTTVAQRRRYRRLEYVFKPLTMVFIIAIAILAEDPVSRTYHVLIVLGLLASLAGDVFLMLESDRFVQGLLSFLVAHILYAIAFAYEGNATAPLWYGLPFLLYGALMLWWLWGFLGPMRGPVIVYMAAILFMAWQAANRWIETDEPGTLLALVGAYLFVASDSVLAVERFRGTFRSAPFWVLSTYFAAQWLIALSVG